jgi:Flp pilus assembly protein TadG
MRAVVSFVRALLRADDGGALHELALVAPLLALLLLGLTELGRFAYFSILVANAASAGVQYGAQTLETANDSTGMANAAENDAGVGVLNPSPAPTSYCECYPSPGSSFTCPTAAPTCTSGNHPVYYVQVTTQGTFSSLFHYPGLPTSVTVSRKAVMRVTQTL